ncbi:MAG: hypothetical protein AB3N63_18640 [Puniceicoccaceae bacterium]
MNPLARLGILYSFILVGITGCTGYAPLAVSREPVTVELLPVINRTELPQIIAPLARNIREGLAHSPNWRLSGGQDAQVQLQVTVTAFSRDDIAREPTDTGRPLSFNETVRVSIEWISELPPPWGSDPVVYVESDQLLYAQPSLVDSETVAMAEIAERLSEKVIQQLDWIQD